MPVRAEYRGEVGGVIHDVSSTGATVFVEPTAVVEANARIMQLRAQEQEEITRILTSFSNQVGSLEPQFTYSYDAMLKIDLLLAKARLAVEQNAFMPAVSDKVYFKLNKARHPLIDKKKVVPVDIELGSDYDTLVITGPNTGGKTVSLKTAGLLNAMAQYGFLIPAHESSIVCHFDEYLVDIGDEQSIEQSLSTFSGHMKRICGILELAGPATLTLLDELGAGTDPAEGAALAVSILERLRRQGSLLMATTHYAELKVYALETPGVVNASCEFNVETLMPTYKLSIGVPGKSNAFLISAKLGIPQEIIDAARNHMSNDDKRLDSVLSQLESYKLTCDAADVEVVDSDKPGGTIVWQSPASGETVPEWTTIKFRVSAGLASSALPITVDIPQNGKDIVKVEIYVGDEPNPQYSETVYEADGAVSTTLYGTGRKMVKVYFDGVLDQKQSYERSFG